MQKALVPALLIMLIGCTAQESGVVGDGIVGDWEGTLPPAPNKLRIALHIAKAGDDTLKGTLDSIDQGDMGILVTVVSLQASKVRFTADAIHGAYEGKLSRDASEISGTWTQVQRVPLKFKKAAVPIKKEKKPAGPSDIDGNWSGTLNIGVAKWGVVFHIRNTEDGLTATYDNPDQNRFGIPVTTVTRNGLSITLEIKRIPAVFAGSFDKDLTTINGTWTQGGVTFPLVVKRR